MRTKTLILPLKVRDFNVLKIDFMFIKGNYSCWCVDRICNQLFLWFQSVLSIFVKPFRGVNDYTIKAPLGSKFL